VSVLFAEALTGLYLNH